MEIDPAHLKSLQRRASSNEKALNYSEALEDLKTLKQNGHASKKEDSNIIRLEKLLLDKSARDREEGMSKLKELGNGLLGKFGMSLDNFVSKPSEGGGYSLNFKP